MVGSYDLLIRDRKVCHITFNAGASMVALRIYPLSPYITEQTAKQLINELVKAKMQFDMEGDQNHAQR